MKKIGIITGASSGMGREFALQMSDYDDIDELWLLARRKSRLYDLEKEIKGKTKNRNLEVRGIEIDLAGRKGVSAVRALLEVEMVTNADNDGFCITWLINNAGFGTYGTFEETPLDKELDMIDINCTTLTGLCGIALKYMNKDSTIINTASLASFLPLGNFAVYGATKAYVLSFSMALAAEVSDKGIKVCALCPGPVSTEFANIASNGARREVLHGLPADKVVRHCLKKAKEGKHCAIMALKWKFKAFASRFVGKFYGALYTYRYCKRPVKK